VTTGNPTNQDPGTRGARSPDGRPDWPADVRRVALGIRRRVLDHTLRNNGGYLSQACSSADALATLYVHLMKLGQSVAPAVPLPFPGVPGPDNPGYSTGAGYNGPHEPGLDRFFFSPVHYALVLYSTLIEVGRMAPEGLAQFNRDGSSVELIGAEHSPGHEVTAGSLAQCLSQAAGVAMARKLKGDTGHNWVFMSDGEFQEGQTFEAIAAMAWHKIDNVTVLVDANAQQCDGAMSTVMEIDPIAERVRAFGGTAADVDGHDPEAIAAAASARVPGKPLVIVCHTDPCRGIPLLATRGEKLHYVRFKSAQEEAVFRAVLSEMTQDGNRPDGADAAALSSPAVLGAGKPGGRE